MSWTEINIVDDKSRSSYELYFDNKEELTTFIRKIPTARFYEKNKCWRIEKTHGLFIREFCEYALNQGLISSYQFVEEGNDIKTYADQMADLQLPTHTLKIPPYPYQRKGIQYMVTHKRCINGDDMGLGKAFQSIAAVSLARAYPCLIVAPAAMKETWKREFLRFVGKKATILSTENKDKWHNMFIMGESSIFITNYESLKKYFIRKDSSGKKTNIRLDSRVSIIRSVVIDESQRCIHRSTKWSQYIEEICRGKEFVWLLTGTPIITGNKNLIQQLRIIGRLEDFGGEEEFKSRYCKPSTAKSYSYELHHRLWNKCYFRRDKSIVLTELPERKRHFIEIEIENKKEYALAEKNLIEYMKRYENPTAKNFESAKKAEAIVKINKLRHLTAEGKLKEVINLVQRIVDGGEKCIVFAFHKSVIRRIKRQFKKSVTVTGSDSPEVKQRSIDKFQKTEKANVIILNFKSGGVGITLTAAAKIVFAELPWTASDCEQAECRAHRNGQIHLVDCYYLIAKNTIDERMLEIINAERENAAMVSGAKNDVDENVINKLITSFSERRDLQI